MHGTKKTRKRRAVLHQLTKRHYRNCGRGVAAGACRLLVQDLSNESLLGTEAVLEGCPTERYLCHRRRHAQETPRTFYVIRMLAGVVCGFRVKLLRTNRSFRYASPHLWNQLPISFHQPCTKHPADDVTLSNSPPTCSPLSPSITHSLFHSRLKTHLFRKSFPP